MSDFKYLFKYIIVGDSGVGKTCINMRFMDKAFEDSHDITVGVEFGSKIVSMEGINIKLQIWDTVISFLIKAGQENFRSLTRSYYRAAAAAILVFDVTNISTFQSVDDWLTEIKENGANNCLFYLVGNKVDLHSMRQISTEKAQDYASKNKMVYIECSAKSGKGVSEIFTGITQALYSKISSGELQLTENTPGIRTGFEVLNPENDADTSKKCAC